MVTKDVFVGSDWRPRACGIRLTLSLAGLLVAACTGGAIVQDKGQDKNGEAKTILFLTEDDSPLAKRLRERGKVEQAVWVRQGAKPSICRLSDLENAKGTVPKGLHYLIEEIELSEKPRITAIGYFGTSSKQRYGELRNMAIKGRFDAVFHMQPSVLDGRRLGFTVCEATRSAEPAKPDK